MSETKFTPGPWEFNVDAVHGWSIFQKNSPASRQQTGSPDDEGGVVGTSEWTWLEPRNAHLIAAAPDLYAALESILDFPTMERQRALNALAKARGESV